MKAAMFPRRGLLSQAGFAALMLGSIASLVGIENAAALSVDTELVLLVDVSNGGLKEDEFEGLMQAYATAMTSAEVLGSIQSGERGRIAVTMMFAEGKAAEVVGIPWMSIGSAAEATDFANAALSLTMPGKGSFSFVESMDRAVSAFGSETGNAGNGFESALQIIEVAGATRLKDSAEATSAALAGGVDQVNAMTVGKKADQLEAYYASDVIGGEVAGVAATVHSSAVDAGLALILQQHLAGPIQTAATSTTIPEPSVAITVLSSIALLGLFSRNRRH